MHARTRKEVLKDVVFSRFFVISCLALFALICIGILKGVIRGAQVRGEITHLQQQITDTQKKNQELTQLITYIQSPQFIEEEGKLKLGLKNSGERVVVIPDSKFPQPAAEVQTADTRSNPQRWFDYFFEQQP